MKPRSLVMKWFAPRVPQSGHHGRGTLSRVASNHTSANSGISKKALSVDLGSSYDWGSGSFTGAKEPVLQVLWSQVTGVRKGQNQHFEVCPESSNQGSWQSRSTVRSTPFAGQQPCNNIPHCLNSPTSRADSFGLLPQDVIRSRTVRPDALKSRGNWIPAYTWYKAGSRGVLRPQTWSFKGCTIPSRAGRHAKIALYFRLNKSAPVLPILLISVCPHYHPKPRECQMIIFPF